MKTVIVFSHPYQGSFNKAILEEVKSKVNAADLEVIDLYEDGFDPVMSAEDLKLYSQGGTADPMVEKYQKILDKCEHLVLIFPVWWSLMPAILKGFLDKVLLKKWAFDLSGWLPVGKLKHIKRATTIATLGGKSFLYKTILGNPLHWALQFATLSFCGIRNKKVFLLSSVTTCSDSKRRKMLQKIGKYFVKLGG